MRKLGAALLAVPVLVAAYLAVGARGSIAGRLAAITGAIVVVAIVAAVSLPPTPSTATPPSVARQPVAADFSAGIHTGHGLRAPFTVHFSAAMDAASVAVAFRLEPEAAYSLDWDASGTTLSVAPVGHWAPDTLYSLVVGPAARSVDGARLPNAVRAVFLTAPAGSAAIAATRTFRGEARVDTAFRITLDRPVSHAILQAAIHTTPAIQGTVRANDVAGQYLYTPDEPLPASTALEVSLEGLVDADGVPFAPVAPLAVTTAGAPTVVRIRPFAGSTGNARDAAVSVRFTEAMSHAGTATAFHVLVNGAEAKGATRWAEGDTVLVFEPARQFPYAATVTVRVDASATSRAGVALARAKTGVFKVEKKPVPRTQPATKIPRGSGGGGAVSGSWTGVEKYYLRLMNCTRTGGWVTSSGSCSSPGGRDVAPLRLDSGISTHVSRPYAKLLATRGLCDHFVGGNPGDRLRRAGYTSYRWAENLGCRSGNPYSAVLGSHLYFQSERSYSGGHYVNLMNAAYDRCGIGVWVSGGRVRLVVDFYHP